MDDPELEQFVLEKSSPLPSRLPSRQHSSGSSSSEEKMNAAQTGSPVSHIISSQVSTESLSSLTSSTASPCSPVDVLPPISQFSPNNSSCFESIYHHEIPKHAEAVSSMENQISENNLLNLSGGNVAERFSGSVPHITDFVTHEQDFEDAHYHTGYPQSEICSFNMSYYTDDINASYPVQSSSPDGMHGFPYYPGVYATQASFDSDDSFEVEYTDQEIPSNMQRTTPIGHAFRSTQHAVCEERRALPNFAVFTECKKVPNRRGRPVTFNKPGYHYSDSDSLHSDEDERMAQSKGCRRGAKNILLWKFLLGELRKPNSNHVKWENEREGIFKFVDTAECSRLWGQMKKKEDMNFEKLSRGIRHYYKDGLMSRRDGIRLVYKFNWERVPRAYWPRHH